MWAVNRVSTRSANCSSSRLVTQNAVKVGISSLPFFDRVAPILDRADDRGVGAGSADPLLLELLDQARLGVAVGGLGPVLLGLDAPRVDRPGRPRAPAAASPGRRAGPRDRRSPRRRPAGNPRRRSAGRWPRRSGSRPGLDLDLDRGALEPRRHHLAGDGALPDQLVEPMLVGIEVRLDVLRPAGEIGRPDRLMGLLGALGLGLVADRLRRQVLGAVGGLDHLAGLGDRRAPPGERCRSACR